MKRGGDKMKYLFLVAGLALAFVSNAKAAGDSFVARTSTQVKTEQFGVAVDTMPGTWLIDRIEIMVAGSADSRINLYDGGTSSATYRKRYGGYIGASSRPIQLGIDFSSGVILSNTGTTPCEFQLFYTIKSRANP